MTFPTFILKNSLNITLAISIFVATSIISSADASTWTVEKTVKYSQWEASLNKNNTTGEKFCSAETHATNGTVFRLNFYRGRNSSFVEVYNKNWNLHKGGAKFHLAFPRGTEIILRGKAWENAYTHDLIDDNNTLTILTQLVKHKSFKVLNANGASVGSFSLNGSRKALANLINCMGEMKALK